MKAFLKQSSNRLKLQQPVATFLFWWNWIKNYRSNTAFKKSNPFIPLPFDEDLFETFGLNYKKFYEDGKLAAKEIAEYYLQYNKNQNPTILDWGCGVGRILPHLVQFFPSSVLYGADINITRIQFNRKAYPSIHFDCIADQQLPYPPGYFDLIYGISVLTHIPNTEQEHWLKEIFRIAKPRALIILSTHGSYYRHQLTKQQTLLLQQNGSYSNNYYKSGARLFTTYNETNAFAALLKPHFTLLKHFDGAAYPTKLGGQDLWLLTV